MGQTKRVSNVIEEREDIVPVLFSGDIGIYALGREFHEAFGVRSVCVTPAAIGAIENSKIFTVHTVKELNRDTIREAVRQIAEAYPTKKLFLICNADRIVGLISEMLDELPDNVIACVPPADAVRRLSDKVEFAEACQRHGLEVAQQEVVNVGTCDPAAPTKIPFPLVAKPAVSSEYVFYIAKGFNKVYYVQSQEELTQILTDLKAAGFTGTFLIQELIEGDDSYMDSITIYVDSKGKARMFGSARVLLEDHAPTMLGNPVAMITQQVDELWRRAGEMLEAEGYHGFANFDIKRDPKNGRFVFLELNPRIGRNSYYNCAGGVNPMRVAVSDLVDGVELEREVVEDEILYTLIPIPLLMRYVRDKDVRKQVRRLVRERKVYDPQRYAYDNGFKRMLDVNLTEANQILKFARYYPKPTDTSF
ncbi:MAG: ATP-grasp domain-containing protein [Atopobiaceae bacterium]|nr:ATP-grasp domain-containing protein [Atopobiaceae bacterium]